TDAPDPAVAGTDNITYTLSYSNAGNADGTGVVISDALPAGTTFVSTTGGGTLAAGVVTWNMGTVASGASGSVQLVVSINTPAAGVVTWNIGAVSAGGSGSVQLVVRVNSPLANGTVITNTGWTIDSNEILPQTGPDATTTVTSSPVLNVSKTDAPDPVTAGN